jgi:ABC-type phosphate transport system substrate-binding protein
MSKRRARVGALLGSFAAAGLALAQVPVHADPAPQSDDVVGVGSDIIQNSVNFLADGFGGLPGYDTAGNKNRIFNFDSVGDANGRNAFSDPALGAAAALNATVVLKAGTSPVTRPNGGGKGLNAIINDENATYGHRIDYARTPNLPTQTQDTSFYNNSGQKDHLAAAKFAQDWQYVATAHTTNAPPDGLTFDEVAKIYSGTYRFWDQIPHDATHHAGWTPVHQVIVPLLPQSGAGVRTIFVNTLKSKTGVDLEASGVLIKQDTGDGFFVREVQQNDPSTITKLAADVSVNAIAPFPGGRYELLKKKYFYQPGTDYNSNPAAGSGNTQAGTPIDNSGIDIQVPGQAGVGATGAGADTVFRASIPYYVVFRQSDVDITQGWQPGSTLNWVRTLFANPQWTEGSTSVPPPFVASPAGKAILTELGLTPDYQYYESADFPS